MKRAMILPVVVMTLLAACASASYTSDYDPSASFSDYRTYRWAVRPPQGRDDPRVYNAIIGGRVKTAVDRALEAKGFVKVTDEEPDFWVAWYGAIEGKMSMTTTGGGYAGWYGYGWYGGAMTGISTTRVEEWDEGTVVIDIIDGERRELVWRGSVTDVIEKRTRSPEEAQRAFDEGAAKLLEPFPPGG